MVALAISVVLGFGLCGSEHALAQPAPQVTESGPSVPPLDRQTREAVLGGLFNALERYYTAPQIAQAARTKLGAKARGGGYNTFVEPERFARALTDDLYQIAQDRHLGVSYSAEQVPPDPADPATEDPATLAEHRAFGERVNFGFSKVEILPGNVGYLKLDGFFDLAVGGGDTATSTMNFLANTRALIIDLRENGGGDPSMGVLLLSYLFPQPTHLSDFHQREEPKLRQNWTLPFVPGSRYSRPIYVLTSRETISAPEGFAYDLQAYRRAVIVGETTAGAANPGFDRKIHDHFTAFIPFGRAVNPVTGMNWEGTGVKPDLPASGPSALRVAHRAALQAAITAAKDQKELNRLRKALDSIQSN